MYAKNVVDYAAVWLYGYRRYTFFYFYQCAGKLNLLLYRNNQPSIVGGGDVINFSSAKELHEKNFFNAAGKITLEYLSFLTFFK